MIQAQRAWIITSCVITFKSMDLFCLFWIPLFYLFFRTITGNNTAPGGVWALLAGSIVAIIQFFLGSMVEPGGFGLSRWVSGCVDIVVLPVIIPVLVYLLLVVFRFFTGTVDFACFTLLWLIPGAAIRAVSWSSLNDPILLVLVPVLWTAIAVGISFFIGIILNCHPFIIVLASIAILIIPFAASLSYWAFFSQKTSLGFLFLVVAAVPMLLSAVLSFVKSGSA